MNSKVVASHREPSSVEPPSAKPSAAIALKVPKPIVRRSPIQGRSQDKVQRILAATAIMADTVPLESITMMQIADAAGASFSSIYRFFPSKEAILEAVAMANLDRLYKLYEIYFTVTTLDDTGKVIDDAVDIYVAFARNEPGFRALWIDGSPPAAICRRARHVMAAAIGLARSYAIEKLGFEANAQLDIRLGIGANATTQVVRHAFLQTKFPQEPIIEELKRWLKTALLMPQ